MAPVYEVRERFRCGVVDEMESGAGVDGALAEGLAAFWGWL